MLHDPHAALPARQQRLELENNQDPNRPLSCFALGVEMMELRILSNDDGQIDVRHVRQELCASERRAFG